MTTSVNEKIKKAQARETAKHTDFIYGVNEVIKPGLLGKLENQLIEQQKIGLKEKAFFFHLFAVLLNAGLNTIQSLYILSRKTQNQRFKRILNTITHDIKQGQSLSLAMEKFPVAFSESELGVIKSGEAIGQLDRMFFRLADQTEDQNKLLTELKGSLTYPIIVFGILAISTVIMFGLVIPKLINLFIENNLEIPTLTKALLAVSTIITDYWGALIIAAIVAIIVFSARIQTDEGRFNFHLWKLKFPAFGMILRKVYIIKFMGTLGVLLDAGVPLQDALKIITRVVDNEVYKLKTFEVLAKVQTGEKISANLATTPFLFPETVSKIIEIGEHSATLSEMCEKISKQYMGEVEYSLKNITTIIGPTVIVIVGVFVAIFALAILGPVFQLSEGIV